MVTGLEVALLVVVIVALVGAHRAIKTVKPLVVNAVVGLVVLFVANWLGFGVVVTPIVVLIVALAGLPGAVLVVLLAQLHLVFEPLAALPL